MTWIIDKCVQNKGNNRADNLLDMTFWKEHYDFGKVYSDRGWF